MAMPGTGVRTMPGDGTNGTDPVEALTADGALGGGALADGALGGGALADRALGGGALADGALHASGERCDISSHLPLMRA